MDYREKIKSYYRSEHFKNNYSDTWVVGFDETPNRELPEFVSKNSPDFKKCVLASTVYVEQAKTFSSKEEAEKFIIENGCTGYHAFCLGSLINVK